jgi:osmoprotectant transport system substrate-binding protein
MNQSYRTPRWLSVRHLQRQLILLALMLLTALSAIACNPGSSDEVIRVGSKDFTEQFILGEMYAQILEHAGLKVERKLNLGGTPVAHAGLLSKQIDLYPEYTGTGLLTVLKLPVQSNPQAVFDTVAKSYQEKFQLKWLQPAPMNNTQALVMTSAQARKSGIQTLSDFVAKAAGLTLIGPPEFEAREDGLPGLKKVYGDFQLKKYIPADAGLRYQALRSQQADVAVGFGTDGEISAFNLLLLKDDKNLFPPYQVAPVIRQQVLETHPQIATLLNALAPKLTDQVMQRLNFQVSGKQQEPAAVAQEFLRQSGLLS